MKKKRGHGFSLTHGNEYIARFHGEMGRDVPICKCGDWKASADGSVNPADPRPLRKFETLLLPPGVFHPFPDQNLCGFDLWIYEFICHVCLNNGAHRAQKNMSEK